MYLLDINKQKYSPIRRLWKRKVNMIKYNVIIKTLKN